MIGMSVTEIIEFLNNVHAALCPRQVCTKRAQPEKFICWSVMCRFPLGAGFLLHLEREAAHDRPTNRHFQPCQRNKRYLHFRS